MQCSTTASNRLPGVQWHILMLTCFTPWHCCNDSTAAKQNPSMHKLLFAGFHLQTVCAAVDRNCNRYLKQLRCLDHPRLPATPIQGRPSVTQAACCIGRHALPSSPCTASFPAAAAAAAARGE